MMHLIKSFVRASAFSVAAIALSGAAHASTFKTLYSFCHDRGCTDGKASESGVILDGSGNLYGVTTQGGDKGAGVLFKLTRNPVTGLYTYSRLYSFCSLFLCQDGTFPLGDLVIDVAGNLYGTTVRSSQTNCGTAFEFTAGGTFKVLHAFNCSEGDGPVGGLAYAGASAPYDGHSSLFGVTNSGGGDEGAGVVYQLTPGDPKWKITNLYNFCTKTDCTDGENPWNKPLVDSSSRLYGTTYGGGAHSEGTVFRLDRLGRTWQETVLHSFCAEQNCADGKRPYGGVNKDKLGSLFGTASKGGTQDEGVAYRLANDGSSYQLIHDFCSLKDCLDGAFPVGELRRKGTALFGVTAAETQTVGNVFQLRPNEGGTWIAESLHNFRSDCSDGCDPLFQQLAMDADGNLFGMTVGGGAHDGGTVFELSP